MEEVNDMTRGHGLQMYARCQNTGSNVKQFIYEMLSARGKVIIEACTTLARFYFLSCRSPNVLCSIFQGNNPRSFLHHSQLRPTLQSWMQLAWRAEGLEAHLRHSLFCQLPQRLLPCRSLCLSAALLFPPWNWPSATIFAFAHRKFHLLSSLSLPEDSQSVVQACHPCACYTAIFLTYSHQSICSTKHTFWGKFYASWPWRGGFCSSTGCPTLYLNLSSILAWPKCQTNLILHLIAAVMLWRI